MPHADSRQEEISGGAPVDDLPDVERLTLGTETFLLFTLFLGGKDSLSDEELTRQAGLSGARSGKEDADMFVLFQQQLPSEEWGDTVFAFPGSRNPQGEICCVVWSGSGWTQEYRSSRKGDVWGQQVRMPRLKQEDG